MTTSVPVEVDGFTFYVEVAEDDGAGPVTANRTRSFDGVAATIEAVTGQLTRTWEKVKPSEASVEFGLKLTTKSGPLVGLLVEGGGEASLTVRLTWKATGSQAPTT